MSDLRFRLASPADVGTVVELAQSAYRGETSRRGWTTEADLLDGQRTDAEAVTSLLAAPAHVVLLAQARGVAVACAHIERCDDVAWFGLFAVSPRRQGQGIGAQVLAEAEHMARTWGCRQMCMKVIDVRDSLIAWYLRRGYRRSGRHEPFPYGNPRFGLPRRDDLRFEILEKDLQPQ